MYCKNKCSDDEQALKNFLLDIECLDSLAKWTSEFNLFDILKITRAEIRHSNMLAYLLNPNENHGLGDSVIRGFIQYVVTAFDESDVFDTLLMDFHSFIIQREWRNIDILAVSDEEKFVLCIENKIDSGEHDNQLKKYRSVISEIYPDYKAMYVFLSPDGIESSEPDYWCSMGYQNVLDIVENARKKANLISEAELLIDNYIETIRRDIVGDEKLAQICAQIYAKHQRALDLIFENKPDKASDVSEMIKSWAIEMTEKGELEVVPDKCSKIWIRFKTKNMSRLLPDSENTLSGWNTKNYYFYEIVNRRGESFYIKLSLSSNDIPDDLMKMCNRIHHSSLGTLPKGGWKWCTPFSTKAVKIGEELSEEKIYHQLNKQFKAIQDFEKNLMEKLQNI